MTTLSTCLSAFGLNFGDKLDDETNGLNLDSALTNTDFNFGSTKFLPDDLMIDPLRSNIDGSAVDPLRSNIDGSAVDPLRSNIDGLIDDPLNMLQDIDQIFSSASNYSQSLSNRSTRTSTSSDHQTNFLTSPEITDIDLDMIQEVLEKEVQNQNSSDIELDTNEVISSDVELDTNEVTVSEEVEEEVPYFDPQELHNYSCRTRTDFSFSSAGESSPLGGSTKEDIEPDYEDSVDDQDNYEDDSNDSNGNDSNEESEEEGEVAPKVLRTTCNRREEGKRGRKGEGGKESKGAKCKREKGEKGKREGDKVTRRSITDRNVTEEEKRLLAKEGYMNFPRPGAPLTKQEEKVLRKVRRKIRNKRSAQCSRQRKKEYVEELEKKYLHSTNQNSALKKELVKLKKENSSLLVKMRHLIAGNITPTTGLATSVVSQNGVSGNGVSGNGVSGSRSFKTSFFVLFLSFFLVLLPFFNPDSIDDKSSLLNSESLESLYKEPVGVGRHLMAYNSSPNTPETKYNFYSVPSSLFSSPGSKREEKGSSSSAINSSISKFETTVPLRTTGTVSSVNISSTGRISNPGNNLLNGTKGQTSGKFIE